MIIKNRNKVRQKTREIDKFNQNEIAKLCKKNPNHFWKYAKAKTKSRVSIDDLQSTDSSGEKTII